jgi:type IV secretion system protein VirD4
MTVYAALPANRLVAQAKWLRLLITDFLQAILSDARPSKVPVLLLIDEASQIGDLPLLRDSIALLRGYGCKVWQVFQDIPMHKAIVGDRFESVVANSGVLQVFAPQDMTTARFLSDRAGQTTADILGYSAPLRTLKGGPAEGSLSFSHAPLPAMLPQDFINMDDGYSAMFSHKTKGLVRAYLPDPSDIASFDRMLRENQNLREKADAQRRRSTRP